MNHHIFELFVKENIKHRVEGDKKNVYSRPQESREDVSKELLKKELCKR